MHKAPFVIIYFMKTITEQNFDVIIKDCFQAILKPLGFKKKGNNFYRQLQDLGQIINIQKSSFYSKDHILFTINIGFPFTIIKMEKFQIIQQNQFVQSSKELEIWNMTMTNGST